MLRSEPPVPVQGYQYGLRVRLAQGYSAPPFGIHQAPLPLEFPGGVVAAVRPSWSRVWRVLSPEPRLRFGFPLPSPPTRTAHAHRAGSAAPES